MSDFAMLKTLKQTDFIRTYNTKVVTNKYDDFTVGCHLEGGTTHEKNIFAECMGELLGAIDNPRYMLMKRSKISFFTSKDYYSVPKILGKKKEYAESLQHYLSKLAGDYELIFTRNPLGRKLLLKARSNSFVNLNDMIINGKRKIKSKWE